MRGGGVRRATAAAALGFLLTVLAACGGTGHAGGSGTGQAGGAGHGSGAWRAGGADGGKGDSERGAHTRRAAADPTRVPGVGDRWQRRIPADSRQVVAVYGDGKDSPNSTVVLYTRHGATWERTRGWPAHNGRKGWTTDHHEGDNRSPVGVFTLSDAGGVRKDPGAKLPYTRSAAFAAPRWWAKPYWHDFDYVIAIDYNRVPGTPPNDPTRPQGADKGGGIWLHMDHGSGTSACVSLSESAMKYLLRTLDPDRRPVVVMGDRADLKRSH